MSAPNKSEYANCGRRALLHEMRERMVKAGVFDEYVWERLLQTRTRVLLEICVADPPFELQILERLREGRTPL